MKIIRTALVSLLLATLFAGSALAEPKDPPPGQDKKAENQEAKEGKADEPHGKADEPHGKADEPHGKADEPHGKAAKGPRKDVIPGNNGTIKVDGEPIDGSHGNEPHVGCTFNINFFNFDEAPKTSTVVFEGHAPSGGGVLLVDAVTFSGSETTAAYSLSEFDQSALAAATPHPQQGYHVKVTSSTDYSNGNDTKSKVFWIDCPTPAPIARVVPPRSSDPLDLAPMKPSKDEAVEVEAEVLGIRVTRPRAVQQPAAAQGTEVLGLALPFTGQGVHLPVLIGLILVAAGMTMVSRKRA